MLEINERTRLMITLDFSDENGAPVTPDSIRYRVDNPVSGTEIAAYVTVVPTASTHDVTISTTINRCAGDLDEARRVTVEVADLAAAEYIYKIRKLKGSR